MKFVCSFFTFIARLCLAAIFLISGIGKFFLFDDTSKMMEAHGLPAVPILLFGAALIEVIGAISLIIGFRARFGALLLLLYLIPVTAIFHNFWELQGADQMIQQIMFLKNLAIIGGLLYVICHGPGSCACDGCHCCHAKTPPTPENKV